MEETLQFSVLGPYRHSDGSFKFDVVVLAPSAIAGAPPDVVGKAEVHVKTDRICAALGSALQQVATQLPPQIMGLG